MADLHHLDPRALPLLAEASLRGLPILHAAAVYEGYTGRVPWKGASGKGFSPSPRGTGGFTPTSNGPLRWASSSSSPPSSSSSGFWWPSSSTWTWGGPSSSPRNGWASGEALQGLQVPHHAGSPQGRGLRRGGGEPGHPLGALPAALPPGRASPVLEHPQGGHEPHRPQAGAKVLAEAYAREIPLYPLRHAVRPGLTGWAQVEQGYAEGKEETLVKLAYDLYYIKHLSFWLDLRILFKTLWVLLTGFGAK